MKNKKIYILICLIVLFIVNTILIKTGLTSNFDACIHDFIFRIYSETSMKIMKIITFFGSTLWIVILSIGLFILYMVYNKHKAYIVASLIIISTLLNNLIKVIIQRARPEYILVVEKSFSYPSGHMMASTTIYGLLIYYLIHSDFNKKYKYLYSILLGLLILLIGISRIFLGAHFATDIIGAFLVSMIILTVFSIFDDKYKFIKD